MFVGADGYGSPTRANAPDRAEQAEQS
jgi:hypothetical protein